MKKLQLNLQQLEKSEVLTILQLKAILGGDGSGSQGSWSTCQSYGQMCYAALNCCSGLSCWPDHYCRS